MWPASWVRHKWEAFYLLLTNPTSVWVAVLVAGQLLVSLLLSLLFPLIARRWVLPHSVESSLPLNIVFSTCSAELHGVCSFPQAVLDYDKNDYFSPGITYAIAVELRFAEVDQNTKLGLFQNQLVMFSSADERDRAGERARVLREYQKTSYIKHPGVLTKAVWALFFPLYLLGAFDDRLTLRVPLADDFVETASLPSVRMVYTLQDRFAQVEWASLIVRARLGLFREWLYTWPLTSSVVLFVGCFAACVTWMVVYWGWRSVDMLQERSVERELSEQRRQLSENAEMREKARRRAKAARDASSLDRTKVEEKEEVKAAPAPRFFSPDEYRPDNVDEQPECARVEGIPGWEVFDAASSSGRESLDSGDTVESGGGEASLGHASEDTGFEIVGGGGGGRGGGEVRKRR